ncbi:MAG: pyruvate kinase [Planctomycetota bacterium]|jgi:pyruvate kinase
MTERPAGMTTPPAVPDRDADPSRVQRPPLTKIIATVGPASRDPATVRCLVEAGVSIFRLNFSHGDADAHATSVGIIREAASSLRRPVAILGDLPGPKIRVGTIEDPGVRAEPGAVIIFQRDPIDVRPGTEGPLRLSSTYGSLVDDVQPGQRLLVDDGSVRMLVVDKRRDEIECHVTTGGAITTGKGINLPDTMLSVPSITERDWQLVEWALRHDLDFLALSFVRTAADVRRLGERIDELKSSLDPGLVRLPIIAKIEVPAAVRNIDSIVDAADGIMVARGDLGVEMDLARVPVIQKQLINTAHRYGKPCIVATQMLQSMIDAPMPTRAEASDVAGAIFERIDAVMLSGETAVGAYPEETVRMMHRIAEKTEEHLAAQPQISSPPAELQKSGYRTAALAHGAWAIAQDVGARFIVVWSQQGGSARYLSQNDFAIPIYAMTADRRAAQQMQLLRGVIPIHVEKPRDLADFTRLAERQLCDAGWAHEGDRCLVVGGGPLGRQGVVNSLAIHEIGNPDTGFLRMGE